jgi:predicted transcriptional regulator
MAYKTTCNLSGLELARYVLRKLTYEHKQVEELFPEFDNNERFVLSILDFLKDIGWIEKNTNSDEYIITEKGNKEI